MSLEFKLEENTKVPVKGSENSAAYDLFSLEDGFIENGSLKLISTGLRMSIPKGYYGQILSRSSLAVKGIFVIGGVIDSDYRGEVKVILQNQSNKMFTFNVNDKIAQIAIIKLFDGEVKVVNQLDVTVRNEGGFGSTGK